MPAGPSVRDASGPCVDTDYYETYNRDNVTLVDIRRTPIERITPSGIAHGRRRYELDVIVFATGFDAMTGALLDIDIRGRDGRSLREQVGRRAADVPRPRDRRLPEPLHRSPGRAARRVLINMALSIEQHVEWIADCIAYLREHGLDAIEATRDAEDAGSQHVNEVADETLFTAGELLVHRREHPGQAARVHALRGRLRELPGQVRHGRRGGVRGLHARGGTGGGGLTIAPFSPGGGRRSSGPRSRWSARQLTQRDGHVLGTAVRVTDAEGHPLAGCLRPAPRQRRSRSASPCRRSRGSGRRL